MEEIPWKDLLIEKYSHIELLIVPPVLTELDNHKYSEKKKVAERARKITNTLKDHLPSNEIKKTKNGLTISLSSVDYDKDSRNMDDQILSCLVNLTTQKTETEDIIAISHDTFLQIKFRQSNIPYFDLGEEYLLPPEPTKEQKELLKTKRELNQFKNRLPKLILKNFNGSNPVKFKLQRSIEVNDEEIVEKVTELKKEYPKYTTKSPIENSIGAFASALEANVFSIRQEQKDKYDKELDQYFDNYSEYLREIQLFENYKGKVLELNLGLDNIGTSPASNIDVFMHITVPKSVMLLDSYDYKELLESKEPHEPRPPRKPRGALDALSNLHSMSDLHRSLYTPKLTADMFQTKEINVSSPTIRPTNSYDVNLDVKSVKHHSGEALKKMYLIFPEEEISTSFKIEYKLICDELPQPIESVINFVNQS